MLSSISVLPGQSSSINRLGTPLQIAAFSKIDRFAKVEYLLSNSANLGTVHLTSRWGSALNTACYRRDFPVFEFILKKLKPNEANYTRGVYSSAVQSVVRADYTTWDKCIEVLDPVLLYRALVELRTGKYKTARHAASRHAPTPVVRKLCEIEEVSVD